MMNDVVALTPVQSVPTMPAMGSPHERGELARERILAELRRREKAREPAPTWNELAAALETSRGKVEFHARKLKELGLITWQPSLARTLQLTAKGRRLAG